MPVDLRPTEAAWYAEYLALRAFGWTHDEYLDTPKDALQWLTRIDRVVRDHEAEQQKKAEQQAG